MSDYDAHCDRLAGAPQAYRMADGGIVCAGCFRDVDPADARAATAIDDMTGEHCSEMPRCEHCDALPWEPMHDWRDIGSPLRGVDYECECCERRS